MSDQQHAPGRPPCPTQCDLETTCYVLISHSDHCRTFTYDAVSSLAQFKGAETRRETLDEKESIWHPLLTINYY